MNEEITEEEIKKVYRNSILLSIDKIMNDLKIGKLPNAEPTILDNGYGVGMSLDYFNDKRKNIRHIYITNPNGKIDPAIADTLALRILGEGYVFIDLMSLKGIIHYMKEEMS